MHIFKQNRLFAVLVGARERFGEQVYIHCVPSRELNLFHDGASCGSIDGTLRSPLHSWSCFCGAAALSVCTLPVYPRWKITLFAQSDVGATLSYLRPGFPILASRGDKSKLRSRSKFADPRYRPRGRITTSVTLFIYFIYLLICFTRIAR